MVSSTFLGALMTSLKSLIPALAGILDMKPAAIYERQRALVRAGLLESRPGRGPGSGVPATPHSVAMLIISIAATHSLSEVADQTKIVANLKSASGPCPLTGKKTFGQALTAILASKLVARLVQIELRRSGTQLSAEISIRKEPGEYYTEDEIKQYVEAGRRVDPDKLNSHLESAFGAFKSKLGRYLEIRTTLYLAWLQPAYGETEK